MGTTEAETLFGSLVQYAANNGMRGNGNPSQTCCLSVVEDCRAPLCSVTHTKCSLNASVPLSGLERGLIERCAHQGTQLSQGKGESDEQQEQAQGRDMHNICSVSDVIEVFLIKSAKEKGTAAAVPSSHFVQSLNCNAPCNP